MSSKKTTTTNNTQTQTLDPKYASLIYGNAARAQGLANTPYEPYTGQKVADFTPTQLAGQQALTNIATNNVGQDSLDAAIAGAKAASSYVAPTITAPTSTAANIDRSSISNITPQSLTGVDLSGYMNPYTQQVIDTSLADLNHQRQVEQNQNASQLTLAGAWRGNSLGVQNAITDSNFNRTAAGTIASERQNAYNLATQNAETDLARNQAAQAANQGVDLSVAGQNAGFQQQTGQSNQTAALQSALANQNASLSGAQINLQGNQQLSGLSTQDLTDAISRAGLLQGVGADQQAQQQAALDWAYQNNYLGKQEYDVRMQELLNQSLGLVPATGTTTQNGTTTEKTSNPLGFIGSLVSGIASVGLAPFTGGASLAGLGGLAH